MRKEIRSILFLISLLVIFSHSIYSQSLRGLVNDGVDLGGRRIIKKAEVNFKKGTEKVPDNFEAQFNLGDAYFKQQRYDEAIKSYQSSLAIARNDIEKSKVHYNVGNSLLKSQKIEESIEEYKKSLKLNPDDQEAKYNLSYALEMLKNQEQQKDQQQDKKDEDKKEEEKKDEQKDKKEEKKEDQQKKQDQQKQDQQKKEEEKQQQQQQPQKISKEEAERILEALKDNEKDLQKELRKIKGKKVKTEKDW
jgi:tetratricopeptide (TPR) repeat protein